MFLIAECSEFVLTSYQRTIVSVASFQKTTESFLEPQQDTVLYCTVTIESFFYHYAIINSLTFHFSYYLSCRRKLVCNSISYVCLTPYKS